MSDYPTAYAYAIYARIAARARREALNEAAEIIDKSDMYDVSSVVNWLRRAAKEPGLTEQLAAEGIKPNE